MPGRLGQFAASVLASAAASLLKPAAPNPLDAIQRQRGHPVDAQERALKLQEQATRTPSAGAWIACGEARFQLDQFDRAIECFEQALILAPEDHRALHGLANAFKTRGELGRAIALYRRALEAQPDDVLSFQDMLFAMLCSSETSEQEIFEGHRRFSERFEKPLKKHWAGHANTRESGRRLRIGYVSADLRDHVAGRCMAPLLARHDRKQFDVHCYFDARLADEFTRKLKSTGGTWHDMSRLDDAQLCKQIRSDRIDVLVDLAGHTPGNRLLALARKPAPVQVSYLDYSATTGLDAMDWRLTTETCDAAGQADPFYSEKLWRLAGTYWLYNPPELPSEAPVQDKPWLLLSCLNSFYRVSDESMRTWAGILRRLPNSRLALVGVPAGVARERVLDRFARLGVSASRIELFGILNHGHFLRLVSATDIALAPHPYNGAMSMLDSLWHGVPVVSLRGGPTFRSAMGNCILGLVDLPQLIACDSAQYADIAVKLGQDVAWRAQLRAGMRQRLQQSPIRDASAFTAGVEAAYRGMWQVYCKA